MIKIAPSPPQVEHELSDESLSESSRNYKDTRNLQHIHNTPGNCFASFLNLEPIPLHSYLTSIYPKHTLTWDGFFQLTLFFAFAPSHELLYGIFSTMSSFNGVVLWSQITSLISLLQTQKYCDERYEELFREYDMNYKGCLDFKDFLNFSLKTEILWKPIFLLQNAIIKKILGSKVLNIINNRRNSIYTIKVYKKLHNNKYPKQSCLKNIINYFTLHYNPYEYDFENDNNCGEDVENNNNDDECNDIFNYYTIQNERKSRLQNQKQKSRTHSKLRVNSLETIKKKETIDSDNNNNNNNNNTSRSEATVATEAIITPTAATTAVLSCKNTMSNKKSHILLSFSDLTIIFAKKYNPLCDELHGNFSVALALYHYNTSREFNDSDSKLYYYPSSTATSSSNTTSGSSVGSRVSRLSMLSNSNNNNNHIILPPLQINNHFINQQLSKCDTVSKPEKTPL